MDYLLLFWYTPFAYTALTSFPTVTANFIYHVAGILKGDPRRFEVIKKFVPKQ